MKQSLLTMAEQLDLFERDIELDTAKPTQRIDETARLLSISDKQVRNLIDSGELEAVPIGSALDPMRRHVRVTTRSIEAFINRRRKLAV